MKTFSGFLIALVVVAGGLLALDYFRPGTLESGNTAKPDPAAEHEKTLAERIREAQERSQHVKGVYMTSAVANDRGGAATRLRNSIISLLDTTELNGVVIDVKETDDGAVITDRLRELIKTLHQKNAWVIARQVVFKDSSQEKTHPAWYLTRKSGVLWRDRKAGSWLDPASRDVWQYQAGVAKAAIDAGFDEIQFDYVRFPSDGDVQNIVYPVYSAKQPKYEVLKGFFGYLHGELKKYKPEIMLSADLFGYVALQREDLGIGQRLEDIGNNFDFVSLMVYPSHYYAGFQVNADPSRDLPALYYPYRASDIARVAPNQPYDVIYRSLLVAHDTLAGFATTAPAGMGVAAAAEPIMGNATTSQFGARLRPWLQDFNLAVDSNRGITYDAKKVRTEIDAAQTAGASGWLLWNASNVYTTAALRSKGE